MYGPGPKVKVSIGKHFHFGYVVQILETGHPQEWTKEWGGLHKEYCGNGHAALQRALGEAKRLLNQSGCQNEREFEKEISMCSDTKVDYEALQAHNATQIEKIIEEFVAVRETADCMKIYYRSATETNMATLVLGGEFTPDGCCKLGELVLRKSWALGKVRERLTSVCGRWLLLHAYKSDSCRG